MSERITIVIPTMNRSEFLIRLLHYYSDLRFQGCICIGDSSDAYHVERTKRAIKALEGKLRVSYHEHPDISYSACFNRLGLAVSTPYTVFSGDDDFLVPGRLEECIAFLENHGDYSAAHGMAIMFRLDAAGPYGKLESICRYPQRGIEADTASQRLINYFTNPFVPLFSVHRTEAWRIMCRDVGLLTDRPLADEGLPSFLSVIQGKIKELDCFYLAFQDHGERTRHPDIFDRIMTPNWASSYQVCRELLAKELARKDGISVEEAREVVKQAWWFLLAKGLARKWEARYGRSTQKSRSRLREAVRRVPGSTRAWRVVRSLFRRKEDVVSLAALLRRSSPYHADFMPIYRAVTNPPADLLEGADLSRRVRATVASPSSTTSA